MENPARSAKKDRRRRRARRVPSLQRTASQILAELMAQAELYKHKRHCQPPPCSIVSPSPLPRSPPPAPNPQSLNSLPLYPPTQPPALANFLLRHPPLAAVYQPLNAPLMPEVSLPLSRPSLSAVSQLLDPPPPAVSQPVPLPPPDEPAPPDARTRTRTRNTSPSPPPTPSSICFCQLYKQACQSRSLSQKCVAEKQCGDRAGAGVARRATARLLLELPYRPPPAPAPAPVPADKRLAQLYARRR